MSHECPAQSLPILQKSKCSMFIYIDLRQANLFPFCNFWTAPRLRMGRISRKQRGGNLIGWHYHPPHLLSSDQLDSHKYIFLFTIQNAANLWYCTHSLWSVQILVFRLLDTTLVDMKRQGVGWGGGLIRRNGYLLLCRTYLNPLTERWKGACLFVEKMIFSFEIMF